ncbi:MAG: 4Fe-4S binding protein [Paludibacter sp.]
MKRRIYSIKVLLPNSVDLSSAPVIIEEKCTQCGTCVSSCPVDGKAINWFNNDKTKAPVYDYKKCIRCYCCQEMCPESAIVLKDPMIIKVGKIF